MKTIKKTTYLGTITLVIVGLLITSTISIIAQKPQTNENKVITQITKTNIKPTDSTYARTVENKKIYTQPSNTLGTPVFSGITPAISDSGSAMVLGFKSPDKDNVYFSGSTDFGTTWTDGVGWQITDPPELPAVDGCGDGRLIGTFVPNFNDNDGGVTYAIIISNPSDTSAGYKCLSWLDNTIGAGYTNFRDVACGGYTAVNASENAWAYGGFSAVGDHGTLGSQTGFFSYQCDAAGHGWIYTLANKSGEFNGATSTSMDIDQATLYSYAVYNYNNKGNMDMLLFIMNFGEWGTYSGSPIHDQSWELLLNTTGNDNKLDISAFHNNVIIVSERDGNIIAYHADDASKDPANTTFSEATITTDAKDPRISHYDVNKAVCEFIKNGASYSAYTEDGGVTWSTPVLVSAEADIQTGDVCQYGYAYGSADTIYFAPTDFSKAIPEIESVSGGIGVSAVIKNVGNKAAENMNWSIVTTGTVFLGGAKSGQITSLQPGASTTIKTGLMLGFGNIDVTITVGSVNKKASGKLLLFFVTKLA